ncbi:tripartite tricarboxylate transporter TctB family protein [Xylanimonas allomyrinae]|uniref:Tripartite tricarboxylate transporter TctB family protein n=1 Tax=Xylanimonas allomyrinae TaxID=2509459 RepID=A0A4P6EMA1_9MICO|nr:tripartite tricarboxylate transporter TctB family protein [Xylanimonas allomyrinae]QAY63822.1 tripartite tricarboxylate transporter TctB family protein [Xylanimonas allomyrinae]
MPRGRRLGELVFAVVVVGIGALVLFESRRIAVPGSVNTLGPRAFPAIVGGVLLVSGVAVLAQVLRGHLGREEGGEDVDLAVRTDWRTVAILAGVFVLHVLTINAAGWPVSAALLFAGSAVALGARPWWKAVLGGVVLALVIQIVFGGMLGLSLPPGPLLRGVPFLHG